MDSPLAGKTVTEFLAWEDRQPGRNEFLRGQTFAMQGDTARCNRVVMNLGSRIAMHLDGTGCQAFTESMKVQISEGILTLRSIDLSMSMDAVFKGVERAA